MHSPTLNEPSHLVAGISHWRFGRFDLYKVNPPLPRMIAALPVLFAGAETDWRSYSAGPGTRPESAVGADFIAANGERSFWLFALARWACIPFSLLGALVCFFWSRELYGPLAGMLSASLWCFCPTILGHGSLITPDVPAAATAVLACYTFWHWLKQPSWVLAICAGLSLGIALLTKSTLLVLPVLWPVMWLIYRLQNRTANRALSIATEAAMVFGVIFVACLTINVGYGFEETFKRLDSLQFVSKAFGGAVPRTDAIGSNRFAQTWMGAVPVPLPANFVLGIDLQKRDFENYPQPSYLRGEFRQSGWWYYYLYALAVKLPLGTWFLVALAIIAQFWSTAQFKWRDELVLLLPTLGVLILVSSQTGFNEHVRYVLPALAFIYVWVGRMTVTMQSRVGSVLIFAALVCSVASSLLVYPHNLSYFNELAGGPSAGPKHLIQSNVDWGQDLLFLRRWLSAHPEAQPLKLAYFGSFDPRFAGIEYRAPTPSTFGTVAANKIEPGWYAISVNFVRGLPYLAYDGRGSIISYRPNELAHFQRLQPTAMAGYSIYIYHVE